MDDYGLMCNCCKKQPAETLTEDGEPLCQECMESYVECCRDDGQCETQK